MVPLSAVYLEQTARLLLTKVPVNAYRIFQPMWTATHASLDHILDAHIYSCPTEDRPDQCFIDVPEEYLADERKGTIQYRAGDDRNVRRMHLAEVRVTIFHANSSAWEHAHTETCHHLGKLIYSAIIDQTLLVGLPIEFYDGNVKGLKNQSWCEQKEMKGVLLLFCESHSLGVNLMLRS